GRGFLGGAMATRRKTLAAREAQLAYWLLAPTFTIILLIVLVPVLLNVWLSFKSITLADLRAPSPVVNERVLEAPEAPGEEAVLRLTMRNGSRTTELRAVRFDKTVPNGLTLVDADPRCSQDGTTVACDFGTWEAGYRETLELRFAADAAYFDAGAPDLRQPEATIVGRAQNPLLSLRF